MRSATIAHQRLLATLTRRSTTAVGRAWDSLATVEDAAPFVVAVTPIVRNTRRLVVVSGLAYLRTATRTPGPVNVDVDEVLAGLRSGVPIDSVYERGVITARAKLAAGALWVDAMAAGRARSLQAMSADVALANRSTYAAAAEQLGVARWVRVPDGEACGFCTTAAGWTYSDPNQSPLHPACGCTLEPVLRGRSPEPVARPELQDEYASESEIDGDAEYITHMHGELGAVAYDRTHTFEEL
jgi:hypothetical protein